MPEPIEIGFLLKNPQEMDRIFASIADKSGAIGKNTDLLGQSAGKALPHYLRLKEAMAQITSGRGATGSPLTMSQMASAMQQAQKAQAQIQKLMVSTMPASGSGSSPASGARRALNNLSWRNRSVNTGGGGAAGASAISNPTDFALNAIGSMGAYGKAVEIGARATIALADKFNELAQASTHAANEFSSVRLTTYGNSSSAARLTVLSKVAGVDTAAEAEQMRERVTSGRDPNTMYYAQKYGLDRQPDNPWHHVDAGAEYMKAVRGMRGDSEQERINAMRALGMEGSRKLVDASPEAYDAFERSSEQTRRMNGSAERRAAADNDVYEGVRDQSYANRDQAYGRAPSNWKRAWDQKVTRDLDRQTLPVLQFRDATRGLGIGPAAGSRTPPPASATGEFHPVEGDLMHLSLLRNLFGGAGGNSPGNTNVGGPEHVALVGELIRALDTLSGRVGGAGAVGLGERGRNAIPGYEPGDGQRLRLAMQSGGLRLGAL